MAREAVEKWAVARIFDGKKIAEIKQGENYYLKDCTVGMVSRDTIIADMRDSSVVQDMLDSSVVRNMWDSSVVRNMLESSVVENMRESSVVENMRESSVVRNLREKSIAICRGKSVIYVSSDFPVKLQQISNSEGTEES